MQIQEDVTARTDIQVGLTRGQDEVHPQPAGTRPHGTGRLQVEGPGPDGGRLGRRAAVEDTAVGRNEGGCPERIVNREALGGSGPSQHKRRFEEDLGIRTLVIDRDRGGRDATANVELEVVLLGRVLDIEVKRRSRPSLDHVDPVDDQITRKEIRDLHELECRGRADRPPIPNDGVRGEGHGVHDTVGVVDRVNGNWSSGNGLSLPEATNRNSHSLHNQTGRVDDELGVRPREQDDITVPFNGSRSARRPVGFAVRSAAGLPGVFIGGSGDGLGAGWGCRHVHHPSGDQRSRSGGDLGIAGVIHRGVGIGDSDEGVGGGRRRRCDDDTHVNGIDRHRVPGHRRPLGEGDFRLVIDGQHRGRIGTRSHTIRFNIGSDRQLQLRHAGSDGDCATLEKSMAPDRRGGLRRNATCPEVEGGGVALPDGDGPASRKIGVGGGGGGAPRFHRQHPVGLEVGVVSHFHRGGVGKSRRNRGTHPSNQTAGNPSAFPEGIGGGRGDDRDAPDDRPILFSRRLDDHPRNVGGTGLDMDAAGRREGQVRVRHPHSDDSAPIPFGDRRHFTRGRRLNVDIADGDQFGPGVDRRGDANRRRHGGVHRRDLNQTAPRRTGRGLGFSVRGSRLVIAKNRSEGGRTRSVNRINCEVISGGELRSKGDAGRHCRREGDRGVEIGDCHPSPGRARVRRVRVRPRVGSDGDVARDLDRAANLRIHRRGRRCYHIGNPHLNETSATGIGSRDGPVIGDRLDKKMACTRRSAVRSRQIAEHQGFRRALVGGGGRAVLDVDPAPTEIHGVGDGKIVRLRGNGHITGDI